jgi:hypothetical protein
MPNHNPFVITPFQPSAEASLRAHLNAAVTAILRTDGQQLLQSVHDTLIDQLTEATVLAKEGLNLSDVATRDQQMLAAVGAEITNASGTNQQVKVVAARFSTAARTLAASIRRAPTQRIREQPKGAGRPLDVWKGALFGDVERALKGAGVRGAYYTAEADAAAKTVLPAIFRTCAAAAGHPIPGDLRNIQRRKFQPASLLPFSQSRYSILRLAKAIWRFLPLNR